MTFKWKNDTEMTKWHSNDCIISLGAMVNGMRLNDGMTFKWWNDTQMMEWHTNDGMAFKWRNDIQMTVYYHLSYG